MGERRGDDQRSTRSESRRLRRLRRRRQKEHSQKMRRARARGDHRAENQTVTARTPGPWARWEPTNGLCIVHVGHDGKPDVWIAEASWSATHRVDLGPHDLETPSAN